MHFTAFNDSEQRAEIWTKQQTIPAASVVKAMETLALYVICDTNMCYIASEIFLY